MYCGRMKIKTVRLNGFKRFSNLTVDGIPESTRLVVVTGPNGSGKSGIFEAFNYWRRPISGYGGVQDTDYFSKSRAVPPKVEIDFHRDPSIDQTTARRAFYIRSAYRHDAEFTNSQIRKQQSLLDQAPPTNLIALETRVRTNYDRLTGLSLAGFYATENDDMRVADLRDKYIGVLRAAMKEVFGDLILDSPGDPISDGTFMFSKGSTSGFLYKNLSGGEKAAFDILLDFIASRETFTDSVYCIDEPELHVGSRVQAKLLRKLLELLPDDCQLWIATHSLGMMNEALRFHRGNPGEVAFLDTSGHDFDGEVAMRPRQPNREFRKGVLDVALDDIAGLVSPETVYICEGDPSASVVAARDFDASVYSRIFKQEYPLVEFVSAGGSGTLSIVANSITTLTPATKVKMVRDRDSLTDESVSQERERGFAVLSERDLENYLLSEEVLRLGSVKYAKKGTDESDESNGNAAVASHELVADALIAKRNDLLAGAKYPDDVKQIAGRLFEECKKAWALLAQPGQNRHVFMRDICAPLITPETQTYERLAKDLGLV